LSPDTFVLFCFEHIGVFRIPHAANIMGVTATELPVLQPLWMCDFDNTPLGNPMNFHPVYTRPFQIDDNHMHMEISVNGTVLTLRVRLSRDHDGNDNDNVNIMQQLQLANHVPLSNSTTRTLHMEALVTVFGHAWINSPEVDRSGSPTSDNMTITVSLWPRPLLEVADDLRRLRLGVDMGQDPTPENVWSSVFIEDDTCVPIAIDYDEWTGLVMMEWYINVGLDRNERVSSTGIWQLGRRTSLCGNH
jgi:hypothetical protein